MGNPILLHRACTASLRDLSHHCQLSVSKPIQPWPLTRLFVRPQTTNWHPTLRPLSYTQSLPSHQPTPSSVTQFLSNKVWQATHRSRIPRAPSLSGRARNSDRPPSPPPRGPWQQLKEWINTIPSDAIFWGILGLNGVVFCAWQFAWANYQSNGDPSTYLWLRKNFTVSMANISQGRIWTLLTASFSHEGTAHLLVNGFTYYFMAPAVLSMLGNTGFLALYLGTGLFSSVASWLWNSRIKKNQLYASHGASGAIYGVVSFFACVAPTSQFLIFGIVPVPAWAFVSGIFLWDSYGSFQDNRSGTDTAGHVGGILAGIGFYLRKRFGVF